MDQAICHISILYRPYFAGRALYLEEKVFKVFDERGIKNIVITGDYDGYAEDEIIESVIVHRVKMEKNNRKWNRQFTLRAIPYLFKIRKQYKIIHMHGFWDIYGLFTLFAKIFDKRIITHMTLIGSDDPVAILNSYKLMNVRMRFLSNIDAFISISTPMSDNYKKTVLPVSKLHQIPNGVDTSRFFPAQSLNEKMRIRNQLGLPEQSKIVIFIGAIIKRKGVDLLIEAWKNVTKHMTNVFLLLVGPDTFDGFDADAAGFTAFSMEMKHTVSENKLNVEFLGRSDQIPLLLRAADLFVLPSRHEGFGNVVVEAMATGLPIIVTEMNGICYDLIEPGKEGFVVHDHKQLGDKIIYLLENDDQLVSMGKNARQRALEHFELNSICDKYLNLYHQLLNKE